MPLINSSKKSAIAENIRLLSKENSSRSKPRPKNQIIAIALDIQRRTKK
jgi:hypothetical protein